MRTGLRSGVSELQLPCFTAVRAEIALMSGGILPLRTTPSVAEQEGQLIETEATGAPQTPSYTKSVRVNITKKMVDEYQQNSGQ